MNEVTKLKAELFEIIEQQSALQQQNTELEKQKAEKYKALTEARAAEQDAAK